MSHVQRLRNSDRIFFVTVNLRRRVMPLDAAEYALLIEAFGRATTVGISAVRLCADARSWHALIWTGYPLTISEVLHDVKKGSARRFHARRGTGGPLGQHQFWDRFVRHREEFEDRLVYRHLHPVRKGLVTQPEEGRWSSYNHFALDKAVVAEGPIHVDYVHLPEGYRA